MNVKETKEEDTTVLDYFYVLVCWRWMIVVTVLSACLIALIIALLLPKGYQARATLLSPEDRSSAMGFGALLSNSPIPLSSLGIPEISNNTEIFEEILKSRYIMERIITQFDLMEVYKAPNMDEAIERFKDVTNIGSEKSSMIVIEIEAPTPQLAADIANAFVDELDQFNREHNMTAAKTTRIFIEQRLGEAKKDMTQALTILRTFQEENQLVSLTEQAKAAVEAAALAESQLRMMTFELGMKRKTLSATHPEVIQTEMQIDEIRKQLDRLRYGEINEAESQNRRLSGSSDFNLPFTRVPTLQQQLGQLMMDARIQQSIFEILMQQNEQAKIKEIHDTPTVRRLDTAIPPAMASNPRILRIVGVTCLMAVFVSCLFAFLLEYGRKLTSNDVESQKWDNIISLLRTDFFRLTNTAHGKRSTPNVSSLSEQGRVHQDSE